MGHFSSLAESTSPISNEIHTLIKIHPAFSYIRTGYLYDNLYEHFRAMHENTSEARIRTVLHVFHILDEIAHSLAIISKDIRYSLPEHIFADAIQNPKYKAGSPLVTHESKLRHQQRLKKKSTEEISPKLPSLPNSVNEAVNDPFNLLMNSFIKNKFPNKE